MDIITLYYSTLKTVDIVKCLCVAVELFFCTLSARSPPPVDSIWPVLISRSAQDIDHISSQTCLPKQEIQVVLSNARTVTYWRILTLNNCRELDTADAKTVEDGQVKNITLEEEEEGVKV